MNETSNISNNDLKELGFNRFNPKLAPGDIYKDILGLVPEDQCGLRYSICFGERWDAFSSGWSIGREKYLAKRRIELKVDEFIEKLNILCKEYKASISAGSWDHAGCNIDDYSFEIQLWQGKP